MRASTLRLCSSAALTPAVASATALNAIMAVSIHVRTVNLVAPAPSFAGRRRRALHR